MRSTRDSPDATPDEATSEESTTDAVTPDEATTDAATHSDAEPGDTASDDAASGDASPGDATSGGAGDDDGRTTEKARRPATKAAVARRRFRPAPERRPLSLWNRLGALRLPLAIAVVLALAGGVLMVLASQRDDESPAQNRALLDSAATSKVIGDVSNSVTRIFSYSANDLAATERAAAEVLEGRAADQYRQLFPQVRQQAPRQGLALTTRVVRAGLIRLTGDSAQLLVFLDQVTTRDNRPSGRPAGAQLTVTARFRDGQWRIIDIRSS